MLFSEIENESHDYRSVRSVTGSGGSTVRSVRLGQGRGDQLGRGELFMNVDVLHAINAQINSEFQAWYQYLAMAAFCEREKFTGAARWLKLQSVEEYHHGMKLFDFVLARNGAVELAAIDQPTVEFDTFGDVFERALDQEERVTAQINDLYELAFRSRAFAEMTELQWFLTEQVEEEKTAREIVARFRLVGDDAGSLLDLDRELGARSAANDGKRR
jgi:ferritin